MTTCLILAAGAALRWRGPVIKQLVPVPGVSQEGTTIIERIVTQCNRAGLQPIVVTHRRELLDLCKSTQVQVHMPQRRDRITDTLLSTRSLWSERNIILLGDTYYSDAVFAHIVGGTAPLMFYGRDFEIYALVFLCFGKDTTLTDLLSRYPGKLWRLYYCLRRWNKPGHLIPKNDPIFWNIDERIGRIGKTDPTRDLDLLSQIEELYAAIGKP